MQLISQERAKHALKYVQAARDDNTIGNKEYLSYASALPAMIHRNGLGQAAAFYYSKKKEHRALYNLLSDWLCDKNRSYQPYSDCKDLLDGITSKDMYHYRLAQAEAQALMEWVKKFAKAFMKETDQEDKKGETS